MKRSGSTQSAKARKYTISISPTGLHWISLALIFFIHQPLLGQDAFPSTSPLTETRPLDVVMVEGIDRFALRAIDKATKDRVEHWRDQVLNVDDQVAAFNSKRQELSKIIGCIDERSKSSGIQLIATPDQPSLIESNSQFEVQRVRWKTLEGIDGEGYFLLPRGHVVARVIAIPDADWTPEQICGLAPSPTRYAADLAAIGCEVLVPTLVSRDNEFSENQSIGRSTNLSHREFIYRQAFELGRHIIGYEVQKVLAAVDLFEQRNTRHGDRPIGVCGVSEGGLLAMYSAAIDTRIDAALVSGYFNQRDKIWQEPIYRNVWRLVETFGDAQIASMIAPRNLMIEIDPTIPIPAPLPKRGREVAAPGQITALNPLSVEKELDIAREAWTQVDASHEATKGQLLTKKAPSEGMPPIGAETVMDFVEQLTASNKVDLPTKIPTYQMQTQIDAAEVSDRQKRTVTQMMAYTQRILQLSHRVRDAKWNPLDRSSTEQWKADAAKMRETMHDELIGRLPKPTIPINPRTRLVIQDKEYRGYEVVLDVYPDVIASGVLLLPNDFKKGERRPVVVCQHGLEGTPMDTIDDSESRAYRAYKSFSVQLVKQGYIVYAPQNPYRGYDAFRTLQRKSNPLGRTLFSYIIPQHLVTLRWLSSLPQVDPERIGFYGLSYGGKTAVRVPPFLPPTESEPGYCLSICSADFNEWVSKNASTDAPFSYVWTPEYEIFEWDMGNLANYAELAMLMAPRPFMVERGHDDGVGIDEWVAWEFAKVRRHYAKLGIADDTEIEFFNGPHTINGKGTFDFLKRHLAN